MKGKKWQNNLIKMYNESCQFCYINNVVFYRCLQVQINKRNNVFLFSIVDKNMTFASVCSYTLCCIPACVVWLMCWKLRIMSEYMLVSFYAVEESAGANAYVGVITIPMVG